MTVYMRPVREILNSVFIKANTLQIFANKPLINELLARFRLYTLYINAVWGWNNVKHNPFVNCYICKTFGAKWN